MQTNIKIVFQVKEPDVAGWPHINFNYQQAADQILSVLRRRMPEAEFITEFCSDPEKARAEFPADRSRYDGLVLITATNAPTVYKTYCDLATTDFPIITADLPHAGSGGFLNTAHRVFRDYLPMGLVASMDYNDIAENVQIIEVLKQLKQETVMIVTDDSENPFCCSAKRDSLEQRFGIRSVIVGSDELFSVYEQITEEEAAPLADRWIENSIRLVEPTRQDVLNSARLYFAFQRLMKEHGCTSLTVDCLNLFYQKKMKAYPCLSFFEMLNQGQVGICEADLDSVLSALISKYGFNRPAFVSDPVLDTSSSQIIYDHCVCSTKMLGYDNPYTSEYYLRSHAEDQKGASVQAMLPLNHPVTTYKFCSDRAAMSIHSGTAVGNVGLDRGCRTKLAAVSDVKKIMQKWDMEIFTWHKLTVYGDWRDKLVNLARMKGFALYEEDC